MSRGDQSTFLCLREFKGIFSTQGNARPGVCFGTCSRTPSLAEGPSQVAAHLGAGGHGDVQVAEDVLGVLILHRLAQK